LKISLSTGVFSEYSILPKLKQIKKLGFENIEFNMKNVQLGDELAVYKIKKTLKTQKINCLTLHSATFPVTDRIEIPKAIYFGKVSVHFANILSASIMVIHSNISRKLPKSKQKQFLTIIHKEIHSYAKSFNIKLALENLSDPSKSIGNNYAEINQILNAIDDPNLGFTLDFCHGQTIGNTMELVERFKKRLLNVHISNKNHSPINSKTSNFKEFLRKLKDIDYNGPLTIELNPTCKNHQITQTKSTIQNTLSNL